MDSTALRVVIHGRVQGVFYRAFVEREAARLRLHGWVRNRRDGTVEALFKGPDEAIEAMLDLCRKGPPRAEVDKVETAEAVGLVPDRFDIKPTV